jgi:hypothetical protein
MPVESASASRECECQSRVRVPVDSASGRRECEWPPRVRVAAESAIVGQEHIMSNRKEDS